MKGYKENKGSPFTPGSQWPGEITSKSLIF